MLFYHDFFFFFFGSFERHRRNKRT